MNLSSKDNQKLALAFLGGISVGLGTILLGQAFSKKSSKTKKSGAEVLLGLEMGGTGCKISVVNRRWNSIKNRYDYQVVNRFEVRTTNPEETVTNLLAYVSDVKFSQIGIASFGPVCLDPKNPAFGSITSTPKEGWRHFPLLKTIQQKTGCNNIFMDTDVNAAALAEYELGGHNVNSLIYVTVGTGVGVGAVVAGKAVHGLTHPEGGHISVVIDPYDKDFEGVCPFHKNCLEGLVTNVSIAKRLGLKDVHDLPSISHDHEVWSACAFYLAQLCLNVTLLVSPEVIILGGGVMNEPSLLPSIREHFTSLLNKYVEHPKLQAVDTYIKRPTLGSDVGVLGAAVLCEHNK